MNVEPLRAALLAEVEAEARRRRAEVDETCEQRLAQAQAHARSLVAQGRLNGEQAAAVEARRRRGVARRRARERRLEAQRGLIDELRRRALEASTQLRADPRYPALLGRLSEAARSQLGPGAELDVEPAGVGGVVARAGSASVDYTLPALVDRAIVELGDGVEALWR